MVAWLLKSIDTRFAFSTSARSFFLSHAVAFKDDTVGVLDNSVEDRVRDGWLASEFSDDLNFHGGTQRERCVYRVRLNSVPWR